jgi:hypothetical protein
LRGFDLVALVGVVLGCFQIRSPRGKGLSPVPDLVRLLV